MSVIWTGEAWGCESSRKSFFNENASSMGHLIATKTVFLLALGNVK